MLRSTYLDAHSLWANTNMSTKYFCIHYLGSSIMYYSSMKHALGAPVGICLSNTPCYRACDDCMWCVTVLQIHHPSVLLSEVMLASFPLSILARLARCLQRAALRQQPNASPLSCVRVSVIETGLPRAQVPHCRSAAHRGCLSHFTRASFVNLPEHSLCCTARRALIFFCL